MFSLYLVLFLGFWFFSCRQFWWVTLEKKNNNNNNIFKITKQRQTGSSKVNSKVYLKFSLIHLFRYWLLSKAASKLYFLWKLWICKTWKINGWCVRLLVKVLLSWIIIIIFLARLSTLTVPLSPRRKNGLTFRETWFWKK